MNAKGWTWEELMQDVSLDEATHDDYLNAYREAAEEYQEFVDGFDPEPEQWTDAHRRLNQLEAARDAAGMAYEQHREGLSL